MACSTVDSSSVGRAMESSAESCGNASQRVCAMSDISRIGSNSPVQKVVSNPIQKQVPAEAPQQLRGSDRVELSGMSHLLKALKSNDVRTEKVADIKAQIEAGQYEDDKKLDAAVDRLLDDLLK